MNYDERQSFIMFLGVLTLSLLMLAVPVLCALSFSLRWAIEIRLILSALCLFDLIVLFYIISEAVE